jgi:lysophospholipase L1-like esterase
LPRWSAQTLAVLVTLVATTCLLGIAHTADEAAGRTPGPSRSAPGPPTALVQPPAPASLTAVSLGDSVPAGSACSCVAFPALYGKRLAARAPANVGVRNLGSPGETSGRLLDTLRHDRSVERTVAAADIVTVTIGANDFGFGSYVAGRCADLRCYAAGLARLKANLTAALDEIDRLRAGLPTVVLVTGYWAIWRDGDVGRRQGQQYMTVGDALTKRVNAVTAEVAAAAGARYVDLYRGFRGPTGDRDDTALLAGDGDHPDAAGHRLIADLLLASGIEPLTTAG